MGTQESECLYGRLNYEVGTNESSSVETRTEKELYHIHTQIYIHGPYNALPRITRERK